ncbi:MAG: enoyl-CoA hydratase/isomerase family protein [Chloroflexota bacterium]
MTTDHAIHYYLEDGLGILQINRPQAHNALNWQAQERFAQLVETAAHDDGLRVLIITGAGDRTFASGGDLKQLANHLETAAGERLNRVMSTALARLSELSVPVIAAVNGTALGGGAEIVTACDLRLAVAHASFHFVQVKLGLTTGWGGAGRLVRLVGPSRALELLLTGRPLSASEACQIGLLHKVVPAGEDVLTAARQWAESLLALPRHALAALKSLVYFADNAPLVETYRLEAQHFTRLWGQPDHQQAMAAFLRRET